MKKILAIIPVLLLFLSSKIFLFIDLAILEVTFNTYVPIGIFYMYLILNVYGHMLQDWSGLKIFKL